MTRKRRSFSAAEKAAAIQGHLVEKLPVWQIADQIQVQPTLIHNWINTAMSQVERTFETPRAAKADNSKQQQSLAALREKLMSKNEVIAELMELKKSQWGALAGRWVPPDTRDQIVDYIKYWSERAEIMIGQLLRWIGLPTSKYHNGKRRYGKINSHNGKIPRDWWVEDWEKQAIIEYQERNPLEGYRRLCFMMLDG